MNEQVVLTATEVLGSYEMPVDEVNKLKLQLDKLVESSITLRLHPTYLSRSGFSLNVSSSHTSWPGKNTSFNQVRISLVFQGTEVPKASTELVIKKKPRQIQILGNYENQTAGESIRIKGMIKLLIVIDEIFSQTVADHYGTNVQRLVGVAHKTSDLAFRAAAFVPRSEAAHDQLILVKTYFPTR